MLKNQLLISTLLVLTICFSFKIVKASSYQKPKVKHHHSQRSEYKTQLEDSILLDSIKSLGGQFPLIILAQAKFESANYHSKLFRENHNLFGMRYVTRRKTTAIGKNLSYAKYITWYDSLKDYLIWQDIVLSHLSTKEEFLLYISRNYSHDKNYLKKLNKIIAKLEFKFS